MRAGSHTLSNLSHQFQQNVFIYLFIYLRVLYCTVFNKKNTGLHMFTRVCNKIKMKILKLYELR